MKKNLVFPLLLLLWGCYKVSPLVNNATGSAISGGPSVFFTFESYGYEFTRAYYGDMEGSSAYDSVNNATGGYIITIYSDGVSNAGPGRFASLELKIDTCQLLAVGSYRLSSLSLTVDGQQKGVLWSGGTFSVTMIKGNQIYGQVTGMIQDPITGYCGKLNDGTFSGLSVSR